MRSSILFQLDFSVQEEEFFMRFVMRLQLCSGVRGPMIESRSQAEHFPRMTWLRSPAQSLSGLCGGAESGIKRIVTHWVSARR